MMSRVRLISFLKPLRRAIVFSLVTSFAITIYSFTKPHIVQGLSESIVISQVYGGGGNTGAPYQNDFIELFNRGNTTINITGWSVQYSSAGGTSWSKTDLAGSIPPGGFYLVQEAAGTNPAQSLPTPDATGTISMSATAGKIALVNNSTLLTGTGCPLGSNVVDFVGYGSSATCSEGSPTSAPSNTASVLRKTGGCTETDDNSADFATGAPNPRNSSSPVSICGSTSPSGTGAANPSSVNQGDSTLLTVTVVPGTIPTSTGIAVTGDLSSIGGSSAQQFFDNGTSGDATAGDNVFSFQATVAASTTSGTKNLPVTITDDQSRTGNTTITLAVGAQSALAIHEIQGSGTTSPFAGQTVTTTGVVTALKSNGFFMQTPDSEVDADPNTSEGIFVFTSTTLPPAAVVGNRVMVNGPLVEFISTSDPSSPPFTEFTNSPTVTLLSTGNPIPTPITITATDTSPNGSIEQLERLEGMRVHVDSLTTITGTMGFVSEANATGSSSGIFFAVVTGIARPFREPGIEVPDPLPAGSPCCVPRFDGNPERLRIDSDGQTGATRLEVTSGATVTNVTGVLDYGSRTYTILPDPGTTPSVSGNITGAAVSVPTSDQFTVSSFNMQRLFDTTNDPNTSDVVLTSLALNNRLNKLSLAVRNILRTPDILGVQEVENLSTLQSLAVKINDDAVAAGQPNPNYQAYLSEGNDPGGIDSGFLVKSSRVTVVSVTQEGADATYIDPNTNQADLLNDRPPLVLRASIQRPSGPAFLLTVINNHLRSLSGVDDPADGNRVRTKRRAQAEFLANLIQARQAADPNENIVSIGDYNAFQFNDGLVDSIGTIKGTPTPSNQVVLASSDLVNPDLTDLIDMAPASQRYSFLFGGNAQELDHVIINSSMVSRFSSLQYGRINSDFPEIFRSDASRPERISDHDPVVAFFNLPTVAPAATQTSITSSVNPSTFGQSVTFTATVTSGGNAVTQGSVTFKEGTTTLSGPTSLNSSGQATFTTSALSSGSHTITAEYGGTASFSASSGSVVQAVNAQQFITITITDVTVQEKNGGTISANFSVRLSSSSSEAITVSYATANGTATAGSDYVAKSGTLTFNPGTTTQTISVVVNSDRVTEGNETFFVNLINVTNATISDSQGVGTIIDRK
jgi:uncharacterized protein